LPLARFGGYSGQRFEALFEPCSRGCRGPQLSPRSLQILLQLVALSLQLANLAAQFFVLSIVLS
jgi:hypothetical protein